MKRHRYNVEECIWRSTSKRKIDRKIERIDYHTCNCFYTKLHELFNYTDYSIIKIEMTYIEHEKSHKTVKVLGVKNI